MNKKDERDLVTAIKGKEGSVVKTRLKMAVTNKNERSISCNKAKKL